MPMVMVLLGTRCSSVIGLLVVGSVTLVASSDVSQKGLDERVKGFPGPEGRIVYVVYLERLLMMYL